ncbi:MAG TPA: TIR domain-containing protein [Croceibacterium sp.]|nr:TIR domain-containing protein [Croceibacterium sp.]
MSDIFISYARPNETQARLAGEALRERGYRVWRDDELPAHRAYSDVIEERIKSARAVLVLWSNDAVRSQWVRAEADAARELGTLVQVSLDGSMPPMPFNQIQCADLMGWRGDGGSPGWQKVVSSIASLIGAAEPETDQEVRAPARPVLICVPPFQNMSGDAEQEYFSDGISEDIIVDLSKVSALTVVPRKTAFALKGKPVELETLARDLGATHFLEGSVRKAGARVRITVELLECARGEQVWAERYDRDLTDIFAIQDEISKAIVAALQLKLLPQEKKAIETRGTNNPDAYNLYLMARQHWVSGSLGDKRRDQIVIRICQQAVAIDPDYARAWALMALAQSQLRFWYGLNDDAMPAAERALTLDPNIPEAYCVKARYLQADGKIAEANAALEAAVKIDPESWEVNKEVAFLTFRQGRIEDAVPFYEKATTLMESDFHDPSMLVTCYLSLGDSTNVRRVANLAVARAEKVAAQDPGNGFALATAAFSLAVLGDAARAKEWGARALLVDPENISTRYNLACGFSQLDDMDGMLELLGPYFEQASLTQLTHALVDPDLAKIRSDPRLLAMVHQAMTRLGATPEMLPVETRGMLLAG